MPIAVGTRAPDFALKDQNLNEVRLSDFRGKRNVLLVFYPLAFTGVCRGELSAIRDNQGDFDNESVQVLTISVDSPAVHRVWAGEHGYFFPLLSDFWPHGEVARAYGVFNEEYGVANRATFIIDKEGVVRFAEENPPTRPRDQNVWRRALAELPS